MGLGWVEYTPRQELPQMALQLEGEEVRDTTPPPNRTGPAITLLPLMIEAADG